jgi:glutamyl-tRNA synthetase
LSRGYLLLRLDQAHFREVASIHTWVQCEQLVRVDQRIVYHVCCHDQLPVIPRVRFAPSPTGLLHVGNARTALYNWLFARRTGGLFILRIEDTDLERSEARYETQLIEDLHWLGLDWDEGPGAIVEPDTGDHGPYRQSERLHIYAEHTERLLAEGKAYRCFCTPEELEAERKAGRRAPARRSTPAAAAILTQADRRNLAEGKHFAVRLKIEDHPLRFHDIVRGPVEFAAESVSDPVLVRSASGVSAGVPVYNYVVTIDDALMGITHVIRGDDHISNTPKQVAIYEAFGWPVPEFAHLSTILGADRERLSKRHGATSISTFRQMGYLPEALANYLALLGWGAEDGKTETFTLAELVPIFSLERVTPSPAIFDFDKLNWLNRHYIKQADPERIAKLAERQFCLQKPGVFPLWTSSELYTAETIALLAQLDPPIHLDIPSPSRSPSARPGSRACWRCFCPPSTTWRSCPSSPRSSSASIPTPRTPTRRTPPFCPPTRRAPC